VGGETDFDSSENSHNIFEFIVLFGYVHDTPQRIKIYKIQGY
jgi:hypothetical protein